MSRRRSPRWRIWSVESSCWKTGTTIRRWSRSPARYPRTRPTPRRTPGEDSSTWRLTISAPPSLTSTAHSSWTRSWPSRTGIRGCCSRFSETVLKLSWHSPGRLSWPRASRGHTSTGAGCIWTWETRNRRWPTWRQPGSWILKTPGLLLLRARVYLLVGETGRAQADLHRVLSLTEDERTVNAARQLLAAMP